MNDTIVQAQKSFQNILGNDMTTQDFKNKMFMGLMEETVELMKTTPHKSHKKNQVFNKEEFIKELVDVQIYLINLMISVDLNHAKFSEEIQKKQKINFERQKNGY